MASLVADYGTSSENDSDSDDNASTNDITHPDSSQGNVCNFLISENLDGDSSESDDNESQKKSSQSSDHPLPNPLATRRQGGLPNPHRTSAERTRITHSVFVNQFQKEEKAKSSILEQHVKMTTKSTLKTIDGKKVCWNFRKGQCRKGHKCRFAHDNDIPPPKNEVSELTEENTGTATSHYVDNSLKELEENDDDSFGNELKKKKRKVGMAQGLVPPKKAMQMLNDQRAKDRPWTMSD